MQKRQLPLMLLQALAIVLFVWLFVVVYIVAFTPQVDAADATATPRPTPCVRGANVVPTPPPCKGVPFVAPAPVALPDTDTE
jgi:hypothetical protein